MWISDDNFSEYFDLRTRLPFIYISSRPQIHLLEFMFSFINKIDSFIHSFMFENILQSKN